MRYFLLFLVALVFVGCKSADPLMEQNLHRAWEVRDEDKRPVISDEDYKKVLDAKTLELVAAGKTEADAKAEAEEFARRLYLPQSLEDARKFERDQAFRYADSLK